MAKKTTTTKSVPAAAKKTAAKKTTAKKTAAKKTPVKKTAAAKTTPAKKAAAKKTGSPKADAASARTKNTGVRSGADSPSASGADRSGALPAGGRERAAVPTTVIARVDVGFGNQLYIRGEGGGLSWDKGVLMDNVSAYEWVFKTNQAKTGMVFKFLINDKTWAEGENLTVTGGGTSISSPAFPM